jgi:hypothetical protein
MGLKNLRARRRRGSDLARLARPLIARCGCLAGATRAACPTTRVVPVRGLRSPRPELPEAGPEGTTDGNTCPDGRSWSNERRAAAPAAPAPAARTSSISPAAARPPPWAASLGGEGRRGAQPPDGFGWRRLWAPSCEERASRATASVGSGPPQGSTDRGLSTLSGLPTVG